MRKMIAVEKKEVDPLKRAFGLAVHPQNPDVRVFISGAAYFSDPKTGQLRRLNKKKGKKTRRAQYARHSN
jgi:hypothetical protein